MNLNNVFVILNSVGSVLGETSGQMCAITRCNYTLFNEVVRVCRAQNDTKVGFVGVSKSFISHLYETFRTQMYK